MKKLNNVLVLKKIILFTSTLMIERHYSHLIARLLSATLAGGRW